MYFIRGISILCVMNVRGREGREREERKGIDGEVGKYVRKRILESV